MKNIADFTCGKCGAFCPEHPTSKQGECHRHPPTKDGYVRVTAWSDACWEIINEEFWSNN